MTDLERQLAANAQLVAERVALGDHADEPRPLDHAVLVPRSRADEAVRALEAAGFRVDGTRRGLRRTTIEFSRFDAASLEAANAFTREIVAIVEPLGGSYDGWGGFLAEAPAD